MDTSSRMTKTERDKTRKRSGQVQKKRMHVLRNPSKIAFKGWEEVQDPWSMDTCAAYIEWCHIDKAFPEERHHYHRYFHKANLRYCMNDAFKNRCIEVYQVLYNRAKVERNEVHLFIARGVHAEIMLGKRVDWSTIKERGSKIRVPHPSNGLIQMGLLTFPEGGLGQLKTIVNPPTAHDDTEDSTTDDDSDGARTPPRPLTAKGEQRGRRRRALQFARDPQPQNDFQNEVHEEVYAPTTQERRHVYDTVSALRNELAEKQEQIDRLQDYRLTSRAALEEKNQVIRNLSQEIARLEHALELATSRNYE